MIHNNSMTLTRRDFSIAALSTGLAAMLNVPLLARERSVDQADALMQLMPDDRVVIYSGSAHLNAYGDPKLQHVMGRELGIERCKITFDLSGNPAHLPAMLGQCCHHMSFTNRETNLKAAATLRNVDSPRGSNEVRYFIETGVSEKTREMAYGLEPVGIIVAVRQIS